MASNRVFAFAPEQPVNAPRLAQIARAKKVVYGHAYSFSIPALTDLIIAQAGRGVLHNWIFDLSQYTGSYNPHDKAQIDRLKGVANVVVLIGHSAHGDLLHDKFVIVDGLYVQRGSANYTLDSERQSNHVELESSKAAASAFIAHWQRIYAGLLNAPTTIKWGI